MSVRHQPGLDSDQADIIEFPGNQPAARIDISTPLREIARLIDIPYECIQRIDFTPDQLVVWHFLDDRTGQTSTVLQVQT